MQIRDTFARIWGLTGTPVANGLLDLFGQCYVVDLGKAFGNYITQYKAQFFTPKGPYEWVLAKGAEELIYERLKPFALRMSSEELLDMPKLIPLRIPYQLPPKARKHYDELEEEFMSIIGKDVVKATNAGVLVGKLRQVCGGALYKTSVCEMTGAPMNTGEYLELHNAKLDAFEDLVAELNGQQVLCIYEYKHDLERIEARFGKVPHIGGGTSEKEARMLASAWNSGELPWLFGHPQSMGHGLNLQGSNANHIIFFTLPWSLENYEQVIGRLRRQGSQAKSMMVYHMIGERTVEESVMNGLLNNARTQRELFEALRDRNHRETDYDPLANAEKVRLMELANAKKLAATAKKA
jgi:SNF2 family DNA or RNA helicase